MGNKPDNMTLREELRGKILAMGGLVLRGIELSSAALVQRDGRLAEIYDLAERVADLEQEVGVLVDRALGGLPVVRENRCELGALLEGSQTLERIMVRSCELATKVMEVLRGAESEAGSLVIPQFERIEQILRRTLGAFCDSAHDEGQRIQRVCEESRVMGVEIELQIRTIGLGRPQLVMVHTGLVALTRLSNEILELIEGLSQELLMGGYEPVGEPLPEPHGVPATA